MRSLIGLMTFVLASVSTQALAASQVSDKLKQNLEIMRDILQKSFEQQDGGRGIDRIEVSYVAGQGVLFRSRLGGSYGHFFAIPALSALAPAAPLPPVPPVPNVAAIQKQARVIAEQAFSGQAIDSADLEDFTEQAEHAAEMMAEQQERLRDQNRELRDQTRDLERELRDVQREKRDIEFSQKVGSKDSQMQSRLAELGKKEQALQSQVKGMQQKYAEAETAWQKQRAEQQKLAQQKQTELIAKVGYHFASTLCDYGASLRELKDSDFVALQLETHGGRDSADVYWLLKKSDINQCITGKSNAEALLKKADYYHY